MDNKSNKSLIKTIIKNAMKTYIIGAILHFLLIMFIIFFIFLSFTMLFGIFDDILEDTIENINKNASITKIIASISEPIKQEILNRINSSGIDTANLNTFYPNCTAQLDSEKNLHIYNSNGEEIAVYYNPPSYNILPKDKIDCGGNCSCQVSDYATVQNHKGTTTISEEGIRFNGWTIDAAAEGIQYYDVDLGRYTDKSSLLGNTYPLYKYEVSNFNKSSIVTFGSKPNSSVPASQKTNMHTTDKFQNNYITLDNLYDGRLKMALSPIFSPPTALNNLVLFNNTFAGITSHYTQYKYNLFYHPYTNSLQTDFNGTFTTQEGYDKNYYINLWNESWFTNKESPLYFDVVLENNQSKKQIIIPCVQVDSKSVGHELTTGGASHGVLTEVNQLGTMPEFVDNRLGQTTIRFLGNKIENDSNLQSVEKKYIYTLKIIDKESYSGNVLDWQSPDGLPTSENLGLANITDESGNPVGYIQYGVDKHIYNVGQTLLLDTTNKPSVQTFYILSGNGPTIYKVQVGEPRVSEKKTYFWAPEQQFEIYNCSILETYSNLKLYNDSGNINNYSNALINGLVGESNLSNKPNWKIKGVRIYNIHGSGSQSSWWTDKYKKNIPNGTISSSNKIIDFCNESCNCSICVATRAVKGG